jgi:hypothetical protein
LASFDKEIPFGTSLRLRGEYRISAELKQKMLVAHNNRRPFHPSKLRVLHRGDERVTKGCWNPHSSSCTTLMFSKKSSAEGSYEQEVAVVEEEMEREDEECVMICT